MQTTTKWENHLLDLAGNVHPDPSVKPFFSYWAGDASLQIAYRQAEHVTGQHSKSFYLATAKYKRFA